MVAALLAGVGMPKKRGRPKVREDDDGTKMIRLSADLVEMISWLVRLRKKDDPGYTAAKLVEPLLRPQVQSQYDRVRDKIDLIKRAEAAASRRAGPGDPESG